MSSDCIATCWTPGPAVELEVLLDLALPLALGRLVDRELDLPLAVRHHLRHERGVLGRDVLVREVRELREAEHARVEVDPLVHAPELDVADDVVDRDQADPARRPSVRGDRLVPGQVRPRVLGAVDERVDVVAVGRDRGELDAPRVVLDPVRLDDAARAALNGLAVRVRRVRDGERDVTDAVPLRRRPLADLAVAAKPAREDEADLALLEHVRGAVADAGLRARVRRAREAVGVLVEVRRLLRVPDPDLEVVPAVDRHEVVFAHGSDSRWPVPEPFARRRARGFPAAMSTPPSTWRALSGSESRIDGEHGGDERLQVRGERRPRRPDPVERAEPENVREDERAEGGEDEQHPDLPAEAPVLRRACLAGSRRAR